MVEAEAPVAVGFPRKFSAVSDDFIGANFKCPNALRHSLRRIR